MHKGGNLIRSYLFNSTGILTLGSLSNIGNLNVPLEILLLLRRKTMKSKKVAIYIRYGKAAQKKNLDMELEAVVSKHKDWRVVGRYIDDGYSSRSADRPELLRLEKDCTEGKVDIVCIKDIGNLTRDVLLFMRLNKLLREHNVDIYCYEGCFISFKNNFDDPCGIFN